MCAQGPTSGSISGAVTDASGAALPATVVKASSSALIGEETTITNEQGMYRFPLLPVGTYKLTYSAKGFAQAVRDDLVVKIGFNDNVNVTMSVANQQQSVLVTSETPLVDTQNSNLQNNFDKTQIANIPNARDIWSLIGATPGMSVNRFDVGGSQSGTQTAYSAYGLGSMQVNNISGNAPSQNRVQVDGVNTTEGTGSAGFYFDYGSFAELQLATAANDASMPTPGTQLNAVIKSGSNQFHGEMYFDYERPGFQGTNISDKQLHLGAGTGTRITEYHDPNGNFGGPILHDRLWFFVSLRDQKEGNSVTGFPANAPGTGPAFTTELQNITYKLSSQLSPKHRLSHYVQWGRKLQPYRNEASNYYADAVYKQNSFSWAGNIQWDGAITTRFFMSARVATFGYDWPNNPYPNAAGVIDFRRQEVQSGNLAGGYDPYRYNRRRWQFEPTGSYFVDNFLHANHQLKFGWVSEREYLDYETYGWRDHIQLYFNSLAGSTDFTTPYRVQIDNDPAISKDVVWHHGAYLQDQIKVSRRITVNAGIRWDFYNASEPAETIRSDSPYRAFFYAGQPLPNGYFVPATYANYMIPARSSILRYPHGIVPRLGLAWDLTGSGKTVLKMNWGRFLSNPATSFGQNLNGVQEATYTFNWNDTNGDKLFQPDELGSFVSSTGTNVTVDPKIKQPVANDAGIFLERQLSGSFSMRVGFVYKDLLHDWQLVETARVGSLFTQQVTAFDPGPDGVKGTADDKGNFTVYDIPPGVLVPASVKQYQTPNDNNQHYKNFEVTLTRRMSNRWMLQANFYKTWGDYLLNGHPVTPNDAFNNNVNFTLWSTHVTGTYQGPWGLLISPVLRGQAGAPLNRVVQVTGLRSGTFNAPVDPVGAWRQDNIWIVDTRVEKQFRLGERMRLGAIFDLFNMLNSNGDQTQDNVVGTRTLVLNGQNTTYQRFLRPTNVISPRIFRLGARFTF
jgi:hypothetical protein